ncbi:hypothetical protein M9Y10_035019 [Tritrichomonas musculus]|uniref:Uncharacterized protein n=1 Tax=Tritrichomonas musculus TaxID=1915356 RepID=A0ABR2KHD3_9EUKA
MGFKNFITSGWNRLKNDVHQGLIGAKNVAHRVLNATKKGLIGDKNYAMNNPKAIGTVFHSITPFATAFNPALGAITSTGANIFSHMPKGSVTDKLVKISEQFARGELKPGGSTTAQATADSRKASSKKRSIKCVPYTKV